MKWWSKYNSNHNITENHHHVVLPAVPGTMMIRMESNLLSGSTIWDEDWRKWDTTPMEVAGGLLAIAHDQSSAHAAAWYSPKRQKRDIGRHFYLEECRVWMNLIYWALQESGLVESNPSFADYYIRFIDHFVRVYEGTAPMFAKESFRWYTEPSSNTKLYLNNGWKIKHVLGLSLWQVIAQLRSRAWSTWIFCIPLVSGKSKKPFRVLWASKSSWIFRKIICRHTHIHIFLYITLFF